MVGLLWKLLSKEVMLKHQYFLLLFLALSCSDSNRQRFTVKTVEINSREYIEWYNSSEISNMGLDRVDYCDSLGKRTLIYKSHYLSDISYQSGTIEINWWKKGDYEPKKEVNGFQIKVDSAGCSFMSSSSRRTLGKDWRKDICNQYLKAIEFERKHPHQYDTIHQ